MNVVHKTKVSDYHSIEIGNSTWSSAHLSIRNRHDLPTGKFSPRNSSEIPMRDLSKLVEFSCQHDALSIDDLITVIKNATESLSRKAKELS